MENVINLAHRTSGEKNKNKALTSVGISAFILLSDIAWFFYRRTRYGAVQWWEILFIVVSSTFLFFSLIGLLFTSSNNKYNNKISNVPLISYNKDKQVFIVQSFYEMKEVELKRDDVLSIRINMETNEAMLSYLEKGVEKILNIGYGNYQEESKINDLINKYKEL